MRFRGLLVALSALFVFGTSARAQGPGAQPAQAIGAQPAQVCLAPSSEPAAAIAACTAVLAAQTDPTRRALAFYRRAEAYIKTQNVERAIADLTAAIAANPDYGDAYYDRALAYVSTRDKDAHRNALAIPDLTQAIRLAPKDDAALTLRGETYRFAKDWARALTDLDAAIALNPQNAQAFLTRASVWEAKGDAKRAADDRAEADRLQRN